MLQIYRANLVLMGKAESHVSSSRRGDFFQQRPQLRRTKLGACACLAEVTGGWTTSSGGEVKGGGAGVRGAISLGAGIVIGGVNWLSQRSVSKATQQKAIACSF